MTRARTGSLSDDQIRTTFFVVPIFSFALVFPPAVLSDFYRARAAISALGGELIMIGWPDGSTITYTRLTAGDMIDVECIAETYKASAAMARVMSP